MQLCKCKKKTQLQDWLLAVYFANQFYTGCFSRESTFATVNVNPVMKKKACTPHIQRAGMATCLGALVIGYDNRVIISYQGCFPVIM